ncbi:hypothetical protein PTSG_00767 [Salpingoeca rosetta]|uniref:Uncharacterized protein n=1 Tax=Salpingoeca rosetta (strain ATCC 50818 / BSB-021) TaxID=946362 RepID=F2TXE8_SALR5|nr:uncharacterized protein PTSG_00767 [Salpingoeca rosetta]EGD76057.1 hypothetical protein PTSG_00767 [Salpingoeca rosetta]|eukprot:XP_004998232.1 hypothetical protein PTSG_00767 [Salpingoeca rosetta]
MTLLSGAVVMLLLVGSLGFVHEVSAWPAMMAAMRGRNGGMDGMDGGVMDTIQHLMQNHDKITRHYAHTSAGITANTTSSDPQVAGWLQQHVTEMKHLVESGGFIRQCDPLFVSVFEHRDEISLEVTNTTHGVSVTEQGTSPCSVALVQAHAKVVSSFVERGSAEARRCNPHQVPDIC